MRRRARRPPRLPRPSRCLPSCGPPPSTSSQLLASTARTCHPLRLLLSSLRTTVARCLGSCASLKRPCRPPYLLLPPLPTSTPTRSGPISCIIEPSAACNKKQVHLMRKDHIYYLKAILDQPNRLEDTDMILAQVTLQYEPVLESKMRALLAQADYDDALDGFAKKKSADWTDEEKRKDHKAMAQIQLHLHNNILQEVLTEKTAATLWLKLEEICMSKDLTSKMHVKQKLFLHRLQEGGNVLNHITEFKEIISDLAAMEVKYDEEDMGLMLLCSLPSSYTNFRDTILYSRDTLTLNEVYEALHSKEKMKHMVSHVGSSSSQGEGLSVRGRTNERSSNNGNRGKSSNGYRGRSKSRGKYKSCKYCKEDGHEISECYMLQNKEKRNGKFKQKDQQEDDARAIVVSKQDFDGDVLVVATGDSKMRDVWVLDTACTFHMTPHGEWFATYEVMPNGSVLMGDDSPCEIAGIGIVQIKMFDGTIRTLSDVRHIPNLKKNLISLSTLDNKGYKYSGGDEIVKVTKSSLVVMKGDMKATNLYHLRGMAITDNAIVVSPKLSGCY
ncbi:uncharacterized protein LOC106865951 isoform X2 [Brachypodium distachyon]|uniref:uncharacterized protein LOC106865951 isoform X2 n=1 Tax=Brachypodium distachyon TaxID=15368 RepID=UPI000D0D2EC9|nr:uncharacterized protein LOC106865951 isoform X2 [Brachypodium distachyon]|eukprot:XP_024315863.1 uncharacterized protein LOC106865951 isoform X2 [Brachypodium distachyon]